jgi:type IV pilus assembly protein PilN
MMIQVNLLPWREETRKAKKKRFITIFASFICLAFLILIILHIFLSGANRHQQQLNDYLQSEITNEQTALNQINNQEDEMRSIEANLRLIISLYAKSFRAIKLLNELVTIIPPNISIVKVARTDNMITLSGIAQSDSEVTLFMQDIAKSPIFNQPVLTEISGENGQPNGATSEENPNASNKKLFMLNVVEKD